MKKQVIILIIAVLVLLYCGNFEVKYLERTSRYALTDVGYTKNAVENKNFELAKQHMKELENTWDNMKVVWNIFITYDELDSIESEMVKYKQYIEEENAEEALVAAQMLNRNFSHIVEKQRVKIENVL